MANVLLGWPIFSDVGAVYTPTLSGGSWLAGLPLTNLQDRRMHRVARSTTDAVADTVFTCDLGAAQDVRAIALAGHNLSSAGTVRVRGFSAAPIADWLTVGDGAWSNVGTPTRSAAAFTCDDGVPLDLIGDDDGAIGEAPFRNITFTGDGEKVMSVRIKQGSTAFTQVALYDSSIADWRHRIGITWTAGVPSPATINGSGDITVVALGSGVYRLVFSADSVVAANTNRLYCYPTNSTASTTGDAYFGDVLAWNAATDQLVYDAGYVAALPSGTDADDRDGWNPTLAVVPSAAQTARYWRVNIADTTNPDTYVDIGRLLITGGVQPAINASLGQRLGWTTTSTRVESDGGAYIHTERRRRREVTMLLENQSESEAFGDLWALAQRAGTTGQVLYVHNPDDAATLAWKRTFVGVLRELSPLEFTQPTYHATPVAITEEL